MTLSKNGVLRRDQTRPRRIRVAWLAQEAEGARYRSHLTWA